MPFRTILEIEIVGKAGNESQILIIIRNFSKEDDEVDTVARWTS